MSRGVLVVRRSDNEMNSNTEVGLSAKTSRLFGGRQQASGSADFSDRLGQDEAASDITAGVERAPVHAGSGACDAGGVWIAVLEIGFKHRVFQRHQSGRSTAGRQPGRPAGFEPGAEPLDDADSEIRRPALPLGFSLRETVATPLL